MESSSIVTAGMELSHLMGKIEYKRVMQSMKIMNANLGSDSLQVVAQTCGMSLRNFNRLF